MKESLKRDITRLRDVAIATGNLETVINCSRALVGDSTATAVCKQHLADAAEIYKELCRAWNEALDAAIVVCNAACDKNARKAQRNIRQDHILWDERARVAASLADEIEALKR